MATDSSSDDRRKALDLLASLVNENYEAGRRSFGASLKPALQRLTLGGFDNAALGFPTFRQFLEAAEGDGLVDLHEHAGGVDVQVTPPGKAALSPRQPEDHRSGVIRGDLWDAFVTWDKDRQQDRFYDKRLDVAFRIPAEPAPLEPARLSEQRAAVAAEPDRFVKIEPIAFDAQLEWMKEFAASVDANQRLGLADALSGPMPVRAFVQAAATDPGVIGKWKRRKRAEVETRIRAWADANGVALTHLHDRPQHERAPRMPRGKATDVRELRGAIHAALDRMSDDELRRVWLPAGALFGE